MPLDAGAKLSLGDHVQKHNHDESDQQHEYDECDQQQRAQRSMMIVTMWESLF